MKITDLTRGPSHVSALHTMDDAIMTSSTMGILDVANISSNFLSGILHDQCPSSKLLYDIWQAITRRLKAHNREVLVMSFYTWITTNITYDMDAFMSMGPINRLRYDQTYRHTHDVKRQRHPVHGITASGTVSDCPGEHAIRTGKALCTGFTDIMYHLCW